MERPFVVCHMLASLDGKIDGACFGAQQTAPALQVYGELRGFYGCQATLYGTTTMLGGYADGKVSPLCMYGTIPIAASFSRGVMRHDWLQGGWWILYFRIYFTQTKASAVQVPCFALLVKS